MLAAEVGPSTLQWQCPGTAGRTQGLQLQGIPYRAHTPSCCHLSWSTEMTVCCHCVFSTTRNSFLLHNIHVQQSMLISYCTSITETECNLVVVESGSKIKSKENMRQSFLDKDFSSKSIPITTTHSWYSFRYKILKALIVSICIKAIGLTSVTYLQDQRCFNDSLALGL